LSLFSFPRLLYLETGKMTPLEQKFIDNPLFLKWVFHNDPSVQTYWEQYLEENSEEKKDALAFKASLYNFKLADETLCVAERMQMSAYILSGIKHKMLRKRRLIIFRSLLQYAAVAVFFFAIGGALVYLHLGRQDSFQQLAEKAYTISSASQGPVLITSNGEKIGLKSVSSTVDYSKKGEIRLNRDSVIESSPDQADQLNQLVIPFGNQSRVVLSDNTIVWLNAGSRLIYPAIFKDKTREVLLFGEAYFEVSENPDKPFVVKTTSIDIKVLGTKFNISAYPGDNIVQTVLKYGSVSLRRNGAGMFEKDLIIKPNQMASFNKTTNDTRIYEVDVDYYTLWTKGLISFEEIDFIRIIKKIERFYNISVSFSLKETETIRISGKLDLKRSRKEVMEYLEKVSLTKIKQVNENQYIIN
jgi:transmembrane sensor